MSHRVALALEDHRLALPEGEVAPELRVAGRIALAGAEPAEVLAGAGGSEDLELGGRDAGAVALPVGEGEEVGDVVQVGVGEKDGVDLGRVDVALKVGKGPRPGVHPQVGRAGAEQVAGTGGARPRIGAARAENHDVVRHQRLP